MNSRTVSYLLAFATFSVACQPTSLPPTLTLAPEPSQAATATTEASRTPTATATATLEPTITPESTIVFTCTQPAPPEPLIIQKTESPNGIWTMIATGSKPIAHGCSLTGEAIYQKVTASNGATEWVLIEKWEDFGLGSGGFAPFYWSEDGERLYFTYAAVPDGCQGFDANIGLWQANLLTGETTQILDRVGRLLSISHDETQAVYSPYGISGLVVFNFVTKTETPLTLPDNISEHPEYTTGQALWAPDGAGVLVNVWFNFCSPPFAPENTALVYVPFAAGQAEIVLEDQTQGFIAQAWPELDKVQVRDKTGAEWWLNSQTGALTQP